MLSVVLDTNVVVSAVRSRQGASAVILLLWNEGKFQMNVSVPLALEYESVLKRESVQTGMSLEEANDFVAFICANSIRHDHLIHRRPIVSDPGDDFLAELAIGCGCSHVVSHNTRHLLELRGHGIKVVTPAQFLPIIRENA
jgi:predicted nucleic acid-binding protein